MSIDRAQVVERMITDLVAALAEVPPPASAPRLLTTKEACDYLTVRRHTLNTLVKNGDLPQIKLTDTSHPLYSTADLDALIERKKRTVK